MLALYRCVMLLAVALHPSVLVARQLKAKKQPAAQSHFIFGYGSLLNIASTDKTNCGLSGFAEGDLDGFRTLLTKAAPAAAGLLKYMNSCQVKGRRVVRISGLQRGWSFQQGSGYNPFGNPNAFNAGATYLGAYLKAGANITGLIYEVDEDAYNKTIVREAGYDVVEVGRDAVTILGGPALPVDAKIVFFGSDISTLTPPSALVPIPYSYIDIWLGGAIDLQKQFNLTGPSYLAASGGKYSSFVEENIKTTEGWSPHIINDRAYPNRPFVLVRNAGAIDAALWNFVNHTVLAGIRYPGQF